MRVIGGTSRGRRLSAKVPNNVRPTSDRVREAIFNILGSLGGVAEERVLDLYSGSGAMGVEALSRGAAQATFVDHDTAALATVRANLQAVGLGSADVRLVRAELPGWLSRAEPAGIAFCDPPYAFCDWTTLLGNLRADVAILESSDPIEVPEGWIVTRSRRYGGTLVTVARATHRQHRAGAGPT